MSYWLITMLAFALGVVLVLLLLVRLLSEHRSPSSTMAWGIAIIFLPYVSIPLYLLFGSRRIRSLKGKKTGLYVGTQSTERALNLAALDPMVEKVALVLQAGGLHLPTYGNRLEFIVDGEKALQRLIEMIGSAKQSVCISTFILGKDPVGASVVSALAEKASQGVEIKLLMDALGCFFTRWGFVDPIRRAGGKVGVFLPILPIHRKWSAHLRNHRKLVLVDHCQALVGGMNLAKEYMWLDSSQPHWADTCLLIDGPAVADLEDVFSADWQFATGEESDVQTPVSLESPPHDSAGDNLVQVAASGPDSEVQPMLDAIFSALLMAQRRVWIVTPYFIPDESLMQLLKLLSRMGRDVRIVVPARSNHFVADLVRGTFFREMAKMNIRLYAYEPGMLHAKLIVIDDEIAFVGSANLDLRSIYLNFEVGVLVYSPDTVRKIADQISEYMHRSKLLSWEEDIRKNWAITTVEDVCRLFAPLL
jgi:cardiolipin synthase A/B